MAGSLALIVAIGGSVVRVIVVVIVVGRTVVKVGFGVGIGTGTQPIAAISAERRKYSMRDQEDCKTKRWDA
jgi:hypothetical protein